jgi:histidine triad (HIT) family protein
VQRISELSKYELGELFEGVKTTQAILGAYFESTDFTVVVHDGPLAGQEIPHVHIHLIPRLEGDGGKALPAMFPKSKPQNPPDFTGLSELCSRIKEASI